MSPSQGASAAARMPAPELILDQELCLNLRGRMEICSACSDQCHSAALQLSPDTIELDGERCTGCGGCIPACPAGVMRMSGFSPLRFVQAATGKQRLHLHCGASRDGGGGVAIPCFKLLDARLVAALAGEGVQTLLLHGAEHCDDCAMGDARPGMEQLGSTLEEWFGDAAPVLSAAGRELDSDDAERHLENQPHMDRRSFLRLMGARATTGAASWFCPTADSDEQEAALFGTDGGRDLAAETGIPLLASLPFVPEVAVQGDAGEPMVVAAPETPVAGAFSELAAGLAERLFRNDAREVGA